MNKFSMAPPKAPAVAVSLRASSHSVVRGCAGVPRSIVSAYRRFPALSNHSRASTPWWSCAP
jgi:hypothetical protein